MRCYLKNYTNHGIKNSEKEKCIQGLKIIIGQHLAEMGSLSSKNHQGMKYSLCVMDVFTKYA